MLNVDLLSVECSDLTADEPQRQTSIPNFIIANCPIPNTTTHLNRPAHALAMLPTARSTAHRAQLALRGTPDPQSLPQ
jgi:hypothetical protein